MLFISETRRQSCKGGSIIDRYRQGDALMQRMKAIKLFLSENIVGQENVRQPGIGHDFCLA